MIHASIPPDLTTENAWRDLVSKLRPFVARRVRAEADADDVLQEVFLRIQRGLPSLRDEQRFGPWVYQVARSAVADHLRAAARHPLGEGAALHVSTHSEAAHPWDDGNDLHRKVAHYAASLVATLPSPYREALTLTELQGMSQKDAAAMLGISASGMKSRVQRGRKKVRAALEECCEIALDARSRVLGWEPRTKRDGPCSCRSRASPSARPTDPNGPSTPIANRSSPATDRAS